MKTFVINLKRRPDRRRYMEKILPKALKAQFTTSWPGPRDGALIPPEGPPGFGLFPSWKIESKERFWGRPLKTGEIGCAVSHWLCWKKAAASREDLFLILEDDIMGFPRGFTRTLDRLVARLTAHDPGWELLYLGRRPSGDLRDIPSIDGFVRPCFSYGAHAYVVTRRGVEKLLGVGYEKALIPVDELLPALYMGHPREDVRRRYPPCLSAYGLNPPQLLWLVPLKAAGSDTEKSRFI